MTRTLALATVLVALAGCDSAPYPEPTNPYDPAYPSGRRVSAPAALDVADMGPTSVTISWTDPSSFETGFRVEVAERPGASQPVYRTVATLPPDATSHRVTGLYGASEVAVRVVTLGDGSGETSASPPLRLRYTEGAATYAPQTALLGGTVSYNGRRVFLTDYYSADLRVVVYDPDAGRLVGAVGGVWLPVGRAGNDGAFLFDPAPGSLGYAVARSTSVQSRGVLAGPGPEQTRFIAEESLRYLYQPGRAAVSADGRTLAAVWSGPLDEASGDGPHVGLWDLASGALLAGAVPGLAEPTRLLGLTAQGLLLTSDYASPDQGATDLRAIDARTGAVRWTWRLPVLAAPDPSFDALTDRVLVPDADGYVVLDAETGRLVSRLEPVGPADFLGQRLILQGDRATVCGSGDPDPEAYGVRPLVCVVMEVSTGETLRAVTVFESYSPASDYGVSPGAPTAGASADAFVFVENGAVTRVGLFGRWEIAE